MGGQPAPVDAGHGIMSAAPAPGHIAASAGEVSAAVHYGGLVLGVLLAAVAMVVLWNTRRGEAGGVRAGGEASSRGRTRWAGWGPAWSEASLIVVALSLLLVGYHVAAWVSPPHWFPLQIPWSRGWMLGAGVVVAVTGARAADRLEGQNPLPREPEQ